MADPESAKVLWRTEGAEPRLPLQYLIKGFEESPVLKYDEQEY